MILGNSEGNAGLSGDKSSRSLLRSKYWTDTPVLRNRSQLCRKKCNNLRISLFVPDNSPGILPFG